jgi:hypothetical protein
MSRNAGNKQKSAGMVSHANLSGSFSAFTAFSLVYDLTDSLGAVRQSGIIIT